MSYNFNRSYRLTIESSLELEKPKTDEPIVDDVVSPVKDDDLSSAKADSIKITDLHIEADISFNGKTSGADGNKAIIKIFNLSEQTRNIITRANAKVILEAGYGDQTKTVFTGQLSDGYTIKNSQDIVTVLECSDGWTPINSVRYNKSFDRGESPNIVKYSDIFNDLIKTFEENGLAVRSEGIILNEASAPSKTAPSDTELQRTWTGDGFLRKVMDDLCTEFNYTWQIIHSRLYVYPRKYADMFGTVIVNTSNIISIRKSQEGNGSTSTSAEGSGVKIKILLEGAADTSRIVEVQESPQDDEQFTKTFGGKYRITSVSHRLTYEGGDWHTEINCERSEQ